MKNIRLMFIFCSLSVFGQSQIVINELSTKNYSSVYDLDGQGSDWLEIYNSGSVVIDISNYSLSDRSNVQKFIFPSMFLNPGEFKIIFLSGKDHISGEWHTNFKYKKDETIYLFNNSNIIIDQMSGDELQIDHSKGRFPDGNPDIRYFEIPTPNLSNNSSFAYIGYTNLQANYTSGFYPNAIPIHLSSADFGAEIHFETNGDKPDISSEVFQTDLNINQSSVIRAIAVAPGLLPSAEINMTYFINENHSLPVISLITDSVHLWNYDSGVFVNGPLASPIPPFYGANFWLDIDFPSIFQFYVNKTLVFQQEVETEIHGGSANRSQAMKSLRLTARKKYGENRMDYPFFSDRTYDDYKELVLRNGSSDFCKSQMRDELVTENLIHSTENDVLANEPCIVYINGDYWGLYNLHEKRGRFNISNIHPVNEDSLDIIRDNIYAWKGDTIAFREMFDYVKNNDLTFDANFLGFENRMDIPNFIDYYISEIYYGNYDWPFNNIECWRERKSGSKFRYMLFDLDVAFTGTPWQDHTYNLWEKIDSSYCDTNLHIQIFRESLKNQKFNHHFVNRYCDLLNTIFTSGNLNEVTMLRENQIENEISRHFIRWGNNPASWGDEMENKIYLNCDLRPSIQLFQLKEALTPGDICSINTTIQPAVAGKINLNSITIDTAQWRGNYFSAVPIQLTQISENGYIFKGWKIEKSNETYFLENSTITISPENDMNITAIYENQNSKSKFLVFPNPASNSISIRLFDTEEINGEIFISNSLGQKIFSSPVNPELPVNDFFVDLSNYSAGLYIISLHSHSYMDQIKFVKE